MINPNLEDIWKEIKALKDEDLDALALHIQVEQRTRQRPEVQVDFQWISGELIESRKVKSSASSMNLKLAMLPTLQQRVGPSVSLQNFNLIFQERILKPCEVLASLGDGDLVIQVVMRRDPIELMQKLPWPNIWRARRSKDPPLSPEFFVIKSSNSAVINKEKLFQTEDSQLWREIQPQGSLFQAILTSQDLSNLLRPKSTLLVRSSPLDVSFFADMMDTGQTYYLMMEGTEGTARDALQPWSNIRPWSDASDAPESLDALVASVKETQEVVPLVERFRQYLHETSKVILAATARSGDVPEVFFNECVNELRSVGLKPLEMLTLEPHFTGSAVIVAANKKRAAGSM